MGIYLTGLGSVTPFNTVIAPASTGNWSRWRSRKGQLSAKMTCWPKSIRAVPGATRPGRGANGQRQGAAQERLVDLERYKILLAQDSVSKQQLDTQIATVTQYEGVIKSDQAQIDNAKLLLTYTRITAPIGGRIGLRLVDEGNMVRSTDQNGLAVIMQLQPIAVLFNIPEDDLPQCSKRCALANNSVEAYNRDLKKKLATGTLVTIDNQIDANTGTIRCKAVFPNEDNALFPNQFVNARLLVETKRDATIVPASAIQRSLQTTFVYVVKDDSTWRCGNTSVQARAMTCPSTAVWRLARWSSSRGWTEYSVAKVAARMALLAAPRGTMSSLTALHSATGRHVIAHGRHSARWCRGLLSAAGVGVATGGLPHHPGADVLSRSQPGRHGVGHHGALERQFGQVPGLKQMTSSSSAGSSVITLQFTLDLNIDVAQQDVQAAINAATNFLPRDLPNPPIYSKVNPADAPILTLALTSQTLPLSKVQDLADTRLAQKISQLPALAW